MVGRRGVEPRDTRLSGRPRRPAGSRPAEAEGVEPPRPKLARVQAGCSLQSASASMSGEGESRTRKAEARLLSGQLQSPICLPLHGGRYTDRTCAGEPGRPFPAGHLTSRSTFRARRAGDSNATPERALVSSEAGHPGPFTLHSAHPGIRTRNLLGLGQATLPIGLDGHASGWPASNRRPRRWQRRALTRLSYNRMEPARRIELRLRPYQGRVLTVTTKQA